MNTNEQTQTVPDWRSCHEQLTAIGMQIEKLSITLALLSPAPLLKQQQMSIAQFIRVTVADRFHVTLDEMDGKVRTDRLIRPRHVAMFLIREFTRFSSTEIGDLFGGRDHGSVLHGIQNAKHLCEVEPAFRIKVLAIQEAIKQHVPTGDEAIVTE